jgi:hypothetical protein
MTATSESPYPQADPLRIVAAAALGLVVFAFAWALLHGGPFDDVAIVDTPVYQEYGDKMVDGQVPYRDFSLEYPPGALPVFLVPEIGSESSYAGVFEALMLLFGAAAVVLVALALASAGASDTLLYGGVLLTAVTPLLIGPLLLSRFDLWPALIVAGALAALAADRMRLGFGLLGAAVAVKIYPLVLLPLGILYVLRRRGERETLVSLGVFGTVVAAIVGPFLLLSPDGVVESVTRQTGRPLQIESLGSSILLAAHRTRLYDAVVETSHGSQNLAGSLPDTFATVQTVLQALAIVLVWFLFSRSDRDPVALLVASAAAVCAFVAFGKVLSPQFLVWLLPLVPFLVLRRAYITLALFVSALVVTHLWFPYRYWDIVNLGRTSWLVLLRDGLLVALFLSMLPLIQRGRAAPRSS